MNRSSLIAATAAAALGSVAHAGLIVTETRTPGIVAQNGTYDEITFKLTSLTSPDTATGPLNQPAGLLLLSGTFSAVNAPGMTGAVLAGPGDSSAAQTGNGYWEDYIVKGTGGVGTISSANGSSTYAASFVNFPSIVPADTSRSGTGSSTQDSSGSVSGILGESSSFKSDWFNTSALTPGPNTKLAQIFVTPGADVSFNGTYSTYSPQQLAPVSFGAASTPEPASVGLLALPAACLLARRRRAQT